MKELWPEEMSAAVAFTFDLDGEEAWIGMDPANTDHPSVLSQGTYGPKIAVPLILDLLARHAVKATFFVPGRISERYPERVVQILSEGHEVAHHGYRHIAPAAMSIPEEIAELRLARRALESLGAVVQGYRAPNWDMGPNTIKLLGDEGFLYSSNFMDDIKPYVHTGTSLVEVPVHWILDDAAHFWFSDTDFSRKISTNEEAMSIWKAEQEGIMQLGGSCVYTFHPQVIGRPGRLGLLDTLLSSTTSKKTAWVSTLSEIALRTQDHFQHSTSTPDVSASSEPEHHR